jgi:hypothetical protein
MISVECQGQAVAQEERAAHSPEGTTVEASVRGVRLDQWDDRILPRGAGTGGAGLFLVIDELPTGRVVAKAAARPNLPNRVLQLVQTWVISFSMIHAIGGLPDRPANSEDVL